MSSKKVTPHPLYQAAFDYMVKSGFDITSPDIPRTRELLNLSFQWPSSPETIVEKKVVQLGGNDITLTIVRPIGTENQILPGLVFLHGGGWIIGGGFTTSERIIKDLVGNANLVVIYVDYSLSPEVKFPVAVEECYESILWLHENGSSINVDVNKLAISGDSAGGNLAAAVTVMLAQRGHHNDNILKGQVLIYPAVAHDRQEFDSYHTYGDGDYLISRKDIAFCLNNYCGNQDLPKDIRMSPLLASLDDLKHVPKALIVLAECDLVRDEGETYARKLTQAGVDTCCVRTIGATHGFVTAPIDTPQYRHAMHLISNFLKNDVFGQ